MNEMNKMWKNFMLNEHKAVDNLYDANLKCENNFNQYEIDVSGIELLLTEAELILLKESREKKFREAFFDKIAALYMSDSIYTATKKDPDEKYPTEVRTNVITIMDIFIDQQPEGSNNKYLNAMGKMLINSHDGNANNLIDTAEQMSVAVEEYHRNRSRMKRKTLTDYKTLESLKKALFNDLKLPRIMKARAERQKDKESGRLAYAFSNDSHSIVYEDDQYFVVRPFNVQASCYFGQKTNWCITKYGNGYFDQYTKQEGKIFYFLRDDAKNQNDLWSRAAIQLAGDEDEQYFEGFWDRDDNWRDEIEDLMDDFGLSQEAYDNIIQAIMEHASEHPPEFNRELEKLCDKINSEESPYDKSFDTGTLKFEAYYEDYDGHDTAYATLTGHLNILIDFPQFIIDTDQEDQYHEFLADNLEDVFEDEDVEEALGFYHPIEMANETGNDLDDLIAVRFNGQEQLLLEMPIFLDQGGVFNDASSLEGVIDSASHYFDDGVIEDFLAAINKAIITRSPDIERGEGYKKVLSLIQRMENDEEIFKNVFVVYETDRIESFDEDYAKDVILDFTYVAEFDILFNEVGLAGLNKFTQKKARQDFDSNIIYYLQRNETPVLKMFRGIIEKIQRAAYQASLKQVKIDFPNYEHEQVQKVMSTPSFITPTINSSDRGIHIKFKSEFEVDNDDIEHVDVAYNYYKYIDDNYEEISKYFFTAFVEYLKRSEYFKNKNTAKYFEKDEEPEEALNEGKFTAQERAFLKSIIRRSR
tara:strand:+ start:15496 stop:17763 length:2268 start_codon:yes stop_codon:yes gene_type:complete